MQILVVILLATKLLCNTIYLLRNYNSPWPKLDYIAKNRNATFIVRWSWHWCLLL